jgi:uncharacterized protein (UPF0332 family)
MITCQPKRILAVAAYLNTTDADEAQLRSVASRAYYACFHEVAEIFAKHGLQPSGEMASVHKNTIQMVADHGKRVMPGRTVATQIAQILERLRKTRVTSDYDLKTKFADFEAGNALERANKVFLLCEEFSVKYGAYIAAKNI